MSFEAVFRETHDDPAYLRAEGSRMDYRDFIPDSDPKKADKAKLIEETAPYAVF